MCERNIDRLPPTCPQPGTCNPGMCPDQESNQQPLALQDNAQPTLPHWSGLCLFLKIYLFLESGREGEGEREKHGSVGCLLHDPDWDLALQLKACVLTRNWMGDLTIFSHTSQGKTSLSKNFETIIVPRYTNTWELGFTSKLESFVWFRRVFVMPIYHLTHCHPSA